MREGEESPLLYIVSQPNCTSVTAIISSSSTTSLLATTSFCAESLPASCVQTVLALLGNCRSVVTHTHHVGLGRSLLAFVALHLHILHRQPARTAEFAGVKLVDPHTMCIDTVGSDRHHLIDEENLPSPYATIAFFPATATNFLHAWSNACCLILRMPLFVAIGLPAFDMSSPL